MMIWRKIWLAALLLLAACRAEPPAAPAPEPTAAPAALLVSPSPTLLSSPTPPPVATPLPTATLPTPTPTRPAVQICSPLEGVALDGLGETISNPFHPPRPGSDDPHQGVDFADLYPGSGMAVAGRPVQAALSGRVAAVIRERFPYGNALLVETRLEDLPEAILTGGLLPTPAPTLAPNPALTCPLAPAIEDAGRSLYLLYAHLQAPPTFEPGDPVVCGEQIGAIGDSGNALNPHLHLEARVGPAGVRFTSLAHYDNSASSEEMANYCLWRVSNRFQLLDPLMLLVQPTQR